MAALRKLPKPGSVESFYNTTLGAGRFLVNKIASGCMISRRHLRSLPFVIGLVALLAIDRSSLSAASGDAIRTGLWVMQKLPEDAQTLHELESQLRANHNLSGAFLHISWDQVEKQAGKPSFAAIDQTVAMLRRVGMKYQLCL